MKSIAGAICPNCKHCEGMVEDSFYICGVNHSDGGLYHLLGVEDELYCTAYEKEINMSNLKVVEMDKLRKKIHELEKEKADHLKGIERLKKSQEKLQVKLNDADKENTRLCNENTELRNKIVDLMKFEDGNNDILRKALDDIAEAVGQPNNTRYLDDKLLADKVVSAVKHKNEESYKREEELEDKYEKLNTHYRYDEDIIKGIQDIIDPEGNSIWSHSEIANEIKNLKKSNEKLQKLERRIHEEKERARRLDTEFLIPLARVLYPREAKICKPYSEVLEDIKLLNKGVYDLEEDCKRLADKNKALFEENIDRLDKHTKQCQEIDNLKNELKKTNELAESWKRDYEFVRDRLIHPIYDILYPYNPNRDINVTDLLNYVKDLKVYADENGSMYKEIQEWREKCIARGNDIDRLISLNKKLDEKISELGSSRDAWSNTATARAEQVIEVTKDRDKWRKLYNSLSEACADYDKRCKEECEKKYRDEISKLQNIVTEKDVEIKRLKKEIINLGFGRATIKDIIKKNAEFKQTISDQEITIKALLITIKEMCKDE